MQIHEILDRMEVLYPTNTFFTDLRKVVLNDDKFALFRLIQDQEKSQLIEGFRKYKDDDNFDTDCFSRGQLESKLWLVKELQETNLDLGTVFLCAGWYATLATMLFESNISVDKIRSFDIDDTCVAIAETFNKPWVMDDWKFKATTQDILDIDYNNFCYKSIRSNGSECDLVDTADTIINTSCEHILDFADWYHKIPKGKLVVLQSNNYYEIEEHVNCVGSIEEFAVKAPMDNILYSGQLDLPKYTRFMLIGQT